MDRKNQIALGRGVWAAVLVVVIQSGWLTACGAAGTPAPPEPKEFTVTMTGELLFVPGRLEVNEGTQVTVHLVNVSGVKHDFTIIGLKEEGLSVPVEPGQKATVEFVAAPARTYEIVCTQPGHKEAGMVGQLIVEP